MKQIVLTLVAVTTVVGAVTYFAIASEDESGTPIFLTEIPQGYRDWKLIAVSRLTRGEGTSQLRGELGNDVAIKAYREDKLPFPMAQSLSRFTGMRFRRRKTTKSSPKAFPAPASNLSFPVRA
jgi:hypothetical protein